MIKMANIYKKEGGREPFHLVFLDVRMPGIDGVEVCKRIREIDSQITIVMISAYAVEEKVEEALKVGASDFISKPFELKRIFAVVEAVRSRREVREMRILVVDDETYTRKFFCEVLEERGCEVFTVENGYKAIEVLKGALVVKRKEVVPKAVSFRKEVTQIVDEKERAEELSSSLYDQGIIVIEKIFEEVQRGGSPDINEVTKIVKRIIIIFSTGDNTLVELATRRISPENYILAHSLNVSILAIYLGLGLGWDRSRLIDLGIAALLHDVGMVRVLDIAQKPRRLTPKEYSEVKKHPAYGKKILEEIKEISRTAIETIYQQHERLKGQGYPLGIKGEEIHTEAQIVGLVDVYEALTHPRVYRERLLPYQALEIIIDSSKDLFHPSIVKVMIGQMALYPIGSWVKLNSGEIGKVISANKDSPARPIINILIDSEGRKLPGARPLNLALHRFSFITEAVNDSKLLEKK